MEYLTKRNQLTYSAMLIRNSRGMVMMPVMLARRPRGSAKNEAVVDEAQCDEPARCGFRWRVARLMKVLEIRFRVCVLSLLHK